MMPPYLLQNFRGLLGIGEFEKNFHAPSKIQHFISLASFIQKIIS